MNKLIVQPLKDTATSTIFIIDAMDECRDEEPTSALLSVLGRLVPEIPKVKFFLTGPGATRSGRLLPSARGRSDERVRSS